MLLKEKVLHNNVIVKLMKWIISKFLNGMSDIRRDEVRNFHLYIVFFRYFLFMILESIYLTVVNEEYIETKKECSNQHWLEHSDK